MKLLIGADISVTKSNAPLFASGEVTELIGNELKNILDDADFRIFNLEGSLTDSTSAISKCGPNIKMPPEAIVGIKALNPSLMTLANNHIMDYGKLGYEETISLLKKNEIEFVGTGENIYSIKKTHILEKEGIKIGVYACAEHEFTIAGPDCPGANPYDPLESFDDIVDFKETCDYLIVLYHGGKEYYRYPSPELQKRFRKMADKGADLVIAQHTHCIGCMEEYAGATLVYGQGNFIFDGGDNEFWNSGILVSLEIKRSYDYSKLENKISYIPYIKDHFGKIRLASNESKVQLMKDFDIRSEQIKDPRNVEKFFHDFSNKLFAMYLNALHGDGILFRIFRKLLGNIFVTKLYKKSYNRIRNYIECESHREVLLENLRNHN